MQDSMEQRIQQAIALREAGEYEASADLLRIAAAEHPQSAMLHALLAHSLTLAKKDQAALEALNIARQIDSSAPIVRLNLARILLKQQKPAEALKETFELYQQDPANLEIQLVLASALNATNQVDQAFQVIAGILASRHDYAEAFATRAVLHYRKR